MPNYKINPSEHLCHPLRVHTFLFDYELEDVWRFPITLGRKDTFEQFLALFQSSNNQLMKGGLAGALFKLRMVLGKVFKWNDRPTVPNHLVAGTLRYRYAEQEKLHFSDLPNPGNGPFIPVFQLENEFLSEIENKTVQAAMHVSRVPLGDAWVFQMAVYVKPRGGLGRFYMALIKPFRLWIVYPSMMKIAKKKWAEHLEDD